MVSKKQSVKKQNAQADTKAFPKPQDYILKTKFAMEEPWHKNIWSFLLVPIFATAACAVILIFCCEQGISFMAMVPLTATFSYGHLLSPRKVYYEN